MSVPVLTPFDIGVMAFWQGRRHAIALLLIERDLMPQERSVDAAIRLTANVGPANLGRPRRRA